MTVGIPVSVISSVILLYLGTATCTAEVPPDLPSVIVDWDHHLLTSKTTTTLQVVVNPLLDRKSPVHDQIFQSLADLEADYVRYVPW